MKLRQLIPQRTSAGHWPFFLRHGIASLMTSAVELTSLGKMTTDWRMTSVEMGERELQLKSFLDIIADQKPHMSWRRRPRERAEFLCQAVVAGAEGALEVLSLGYLKADWHMAWLCYGEDIVDWCADRLPGKSS